MTDILGKSNLLKTILKMLCKYLLLKLEGYDEKLSDISKITTNESNISSNLTKLGDNDDDIDEIKSNLNNIKNDLSDFKINHSIQNLFIYNINVENSYTLNKDNPKFSIFSYN